MRVFIFSDLNLISINPILKKYCSLIDDIVYTQIQRMAWEESINLIKSYEINQRDLVIFWFSRSNLFRCQMIYDSVNVNEEKFIKNIHLNALENLSFFMSLGLEIIFFAPSYRLITSQDFELQNYLDEHSRSWEYYTHTLIEKKGVKVIYETDFLELNHFSKRLWYAAKNPYLPAYLKYLSLKIEQIISKLHTPIKVIAFDLDDTIWGGVIGEDGKDGIRLGGHDMRGELFIDIQRIILNLKSKGMIIGVLSKNNLEEALSVFRSHNEMLIKESDLDFIFCNWEEKFINLEKAAMQLNLSLDSFAFIDNSHIEREKMLNALPQVKTLELPDDEFEWANYISSTLKISQNTTKEDKLRDKHYKLEKLRDKEVKARIFNGSNIKDINKILDVKIKEEKFNIARIEQLFSRTNQFNLSTRRLNREQIIAYEETNNKFLKSFRVEDKFGDYGICAVYCAEKINKKIHVTDLAISCRALGRSVEDFVFNDIVNLCIINNLSEIYFHFIETKKNRPLIKFLVEKGISLEKLTYQIKI